MFHDTGVYEIGNDPLCCSLCDPHPVGDLTHADAPVARDAEKDAGVVGDEPPSGFIAA